MEKKVEILKKTRQYDGVFKLDKVRLRHQQLDDTMSEPMSRLVFERGDAVAVLLYHRGQDSVLLVEQFRYPTYARGDDGWLLEIVAGIQEPEEEQVTVAQRELLEETGYQVTELEDLGQFYTSPGACTERIRLYLGYLDTAEQIGSGGGKADEHEDIRLVEIPFPKSLALIASGEIRDAKTIIALQHLALKKQGEQRQAGS
jgi:ADP-ribose pyrophosphatase